MTENKLRTVLSAFFMLSHVSLLLVVLALFLAHRFIQEEFTTTMGIMVPALGALTTLAVTYAVSVKEKKAYVVASEPLSGIYIFTALLFPIAFLLILLALILMKGFYVLPFEPFKLSLGAVETIFAGYTGKVMASLFGKTPE